MQTGFKDLPGGTWVAQLVKPLTLAQVMISQFVSLSLVLCSVLTARSLEPALDSVSPSLSAPPLLMLCLSLSFKKKKKDLPRVLLCLHKCFPAWLQVRNICVAF